MVGTKSPLWELWSRNGSGASPQAKPLNRKCWLCLTKAQPFLIFFGRNGPGSKKDYPFTIYIYIFVWHRLLLGETHFESWPFFFPNSDPSPEDHVGLILRANHTITIIAAVFHWFRMVSCRSSRVSRAPVHMFFSRFCRIFVAFSFLE